MIYLAALLLMLAMLGCWLGLEYLLRNVAIERYLGPDDIWSEDECEDEQRGC
ncbi:hypothetical protein [Phytohalomonas tamaricis]|uniref:hypothetical protein n=1 Tax=Phytohalomonas tamaricis TaxID=2081032 RepID=UPI001319E8F9|nr:hypothetical protein [Phytohalomonas tamaricis]